jgi:hypothetical protein
LKLPNVFFLDLRASGLRGRTLPTYRGGEREGGREGKRENITVIIHHRAKASAN